MIMINDLEKGGPGSGKYKHKKTGVHVKPKNTATDLKTARAKAQMADWKESQEKNDKSTEYKTWGMKYKRAHIDHADAQKEMDYYNERKGKPLSAW
jgi:hypothetical protein